LCPRRDGDDVLDSIGHALSIFARSPSKADSMLTPQDKKVLGDIQEFIRKLISPSGLDEDSFHFVKSNARKHRTELEKIIAKV
jgi:hypothetical protein